MARGAGLHFYVQYPLLNLIQMKFIFWRSDNDSEVSGSEIGAWAGVVGLNGKFVGGEGEGVGAGGAKAGAGAGEAGGLLC